MPLRRLQSPRPSGAPALAPASAVAPRDADDAPARPLRPGPLALREIVRSGRNARRVPRRALALRYQLTYGTNNNNNNNNIPYYCGGRHAGCNRERGAQHLRHTRPHDRGGRRRAREMSMTPRRETGEWGGRAGLGTAQVRRGIAGCNPGRTGKGACVRCRCVSAGAQRRRSARGGASKGEGCGKARAAAAFEGWKRGWVLGGGG